MVAMFTGLGAGAERGSGNVLGNAGMLWSSGLGRANERIHVNAATGNLLIQQQDEMLIGRGPDVAVGRTYNSLGDLSDENGDNWRQSTDRRVYGLTGTANASGSTVKRVSADGAEITYAWNASASAYVATDGAGAYDRLTWTASNATWSWTDGDSQQTETYGYAAGSGRYLITRATDTKGNSLTFAYLNGGKLDKVTTADGGYTRYGWSGNNITQIVTGYTDYASNSAKTLTRTRYGYDSSNRLTTVTVDLSPTDNSVTDGKTYVTTYTYDGTSKRVASISQTDGSSLAITYDSALRVKTLEQTAASGITRTTSLDYQSGYTSITDPTGQVTRLDYDNKGQLTKITAPPAASGATAQVTQFAYNANGDLTSVTDPLGNVTSYASFTANGMAQTVTDRLGHATTRTFGSKNELLTETRTAADQSGAAVQQTARWVYDTNNRVRFELSPDGNVVEHRYDDSSGKGGVEVLTLTYTAARYDVSGLGKTATPSLSQMNSWASNADKTQISQRSYTYDARGNMTASYGYGTLDSSGAGDTQGGVFYTYDQAGQLLSTNRYAHAAETYVYDGMGRVVSSVDLAGGTTSIVFNDAASTTVVTLAAGLVQTSTYNQAGERVSWSESGTNIATGTAAYKYDALGRMRMATDATGHNSYVIYDQAGRKVADVDHYGMVTEYRYDANDRVVGRVAYANYLTTAQLATLADPLAAVDIATIRPAATAGDLWAWTVYDGEGRILQTIDGTGRTIVNAYDAAGRRVRSTAYYNMLTATQVSGFKTTPPTAVTLPTTDSARDAVSRTFYDRNGRMVGMLDGEGFLTRIDYDAGGRKIAETAFATATTASNRANGSFATLVDGLANAAADRTTRMVYDGLGQMVFSIDALNRVTEMVYPNGDAADVNGLARQTIRYAGSIAAPSRWTVASVRAALNDAGLADRADNRTTWAIYDDRDNLAYAIDATGAVTGYRHDVSGNVTRVTRYATLRATTSLPTAAAMDSWADANANVGDDRVTRHWYDARNDLRYVVDGEGFVTRTDFDAEGRPTGTAAFVDAIAVTDTTSYAQVAAAATGRAITTATAYDMSGRVASETDGTGAVTAYIYDAAGGLLGKTLRANGSADASQTSYGYDAAGRMVSRTDGVGTDEAATTAMVYDGIGNLLVTTDPNGNSVTATYDRAGRRITESDAEGLTTSYAYNAFDQVVAVTDPRGKTAYRYYDLTGRTTTTRDAIGRVTVTSHNAFGEVTRSLRYANLASDAASATTLPNVIADGARDAVTDWTYDKAGRISTITDAEAAVTTQAYNAFGDMVARVDPLDGRSIVTTATYDRRGLLKTRIVDAASGGKALTISYGHDAFGREVTLADARDSTGTRTYDDAGRLASTTDALGNVTAYAYDKRGNLAAVTDAKGAVTRYAYDAFDRRVYTVDALGGVVRTEYDKAGNAIRTIGYAAPIALAGLSAVTTAAAITARVSANPAADTPSRSIYDRDDRLRFTVDGAGSLTEMLYDGADHLVRTITYPVAVADSATFTVAGMQAAIAAMTTAEREAAPVSRSVFDASGQRVYGIDASGFVTAFTYDSRGNKTSERRFVTAYTGTDDPSDAAMASWAAANADPADRVTRALYDREDRLRIDVDAEGYVTQYAYDQASHLIQKIRYPDRYPAIDGATTLDQASALIGATPPATAQVTAYAYDSAGRLESETRDAGAGRLNQVTTFVSDANGNVVAETDVAGRTTRYVYDAANRRIAAVDALGGVTAMGYDALGRIAWTKSYATPIARATLDAYPPAITLAQASVSAAANDRVTRTFHDAAGRQAFAVDGEGFVTERRYDGVGNLTTTIRYAAVISGLTDATTTGELAALLPAAIPVDAAVTRYGYDRTSRLTERTDPDGSVTRFDYDALGDAVRTTAAYGTADAATTTRVFDKRGQLVREIGAGAITGTDYGYNAFGERVSTTDPLSFSVTTAYDRLGRATTETVPVGATDAGLATTSVYDAFGRVVQITDPNGHSGYFHYDNLDRLIAQVDAEGYVTQTNWTPTGQKDSVIRYAERAVSPGSATTMPVVYGSGADAITSFGYDRLDRLVATTDARGNTERYVLDAFGDRVAVVNKLGGVTFNSYDRRGLLVEAMTQVRWTDPARGLAMGSNIANTYAYDAGGNLSVKVEAAGRPEARTTRYTYDGLDRITATIGDPVEILVDPELGTTAMVAPIERTIYDRRGNVIERVDANGARSLTYYDGQDRKIAELSAVGTLTTWHYDGAGNAVLRRVYGDPVALPTAAGGTPPAPANAGNVRETAYAYDRNNRLVSTSVAAAVAGRYDGANYVTVQGVTTAVAYDGLGNVVRATDGNGATVLHWFDRLGREIGKVDGEGYLTSWVRDAEGNVTAERRYANRVGGTYSETTSLATVIGQTVADAANDRVTLFAYNRNGQRIREERLGVTGLMDGATGTEAAATSAVIRYTYNALGEVLSKHEATGDVTQYSYDDSGRLIRQQDAPIGSLGGIRRTTDFTYDDLNNLLTARESGSVDTSAPVVFEDIVPAVRPVPVPVTTASFGIATADGYSRVHGSSGNDYMYMISAVEGGGNNYGLEGGDGDDWLINSSWNGMMDGGAGNDVLEFRTFLYGVGGAGSDYFVFDMGHLVGQQYGYSPEERWGDIADFTPGVDKIAILNAITSFADLTIVQNGADAEVRFLHAPRIVLRNTDAASVTAADFVIDRSGFTGSRPIGDRLPTPLITNRPTGTNYESQGTAGNDLIVLPGEGHGRAFGGGDGDDHLISGQWLSTVGGGDGNDLIEVRSVGVLAIGGNGNDTFVFDDSIFSPNDWIRNPQYDWGMIAGFAPGRDRIVIPGRSFAELTFTQVGADVHVTMANAPRIILQSLTVAEIQPSDFTFSPADPVIAMPQRSAAPTTAPITPAATDRVNAFVYGAGGRLVSQTDATGFTRSFAYDAVGRVLRESYDRERSNGDVVTEGRFTQYDAVGRTVGRYAASLSNDRWYRGDLSTTGYDAFGDAVFTAVNGTVQERRVYDALGRVVKTNARDGVWREYGYDGNGNATLTVASNGFDATEAAVGALLQRGLAGNADAVVTYTTYDRRNLATASYEVGRERGLQADGTSAAPVTLSRTQAHNAFGDVVSDVDPRGATTSYRYNSIGKLIERNGPTVTVTLADTNSVSQSPTDRFYYDLSGRAIGTRDANGYLTRRTLLEGRGYGDEEALVRVEYRPDASTNTSEYNVFGDAIAAIDGLGRRTDRTFDKLGRLLTQAMPGATTTRLTDTYAYDGLGQRIRHSNSVYQAPVVGQTYPYYDEVAGGTFYLSPSGRYLIQGDTGGAAGTNKGLTMPVSYPATGPEERRWVYDSVRGYAVLLPAGVTTYESPEDDGEGGAPGLVVAGVETTDYDLQGRVVASVDFAGDLTTYSYQWSASAQTAGLGVTGGWVKTVSTPADRFGVDGAVAASETTDSFGHVQQRTDQGGNLTQVEYSLAGRATTETHSDPAGGWTVSFGYYNTGLLANVTEAGQAATYGYDASGNRVYERLVAGSTVKQDSRATYDLLGRMATWTDLAADGGVANAALSWSYDAVGNIRSLTQSYRPMDPTGLSSLQSGPQTRWYLYDAMNRVVLDQGERAGGTIVRGGGVSLLYDAAGQRVSATTATGVTAAGQEGTASSGEHRERYVYSDDGQLVAVYQSDAVTAGSFGPETLLASYQRDALGRVLSEQQYDPDGATVVRSRYGIAYDNRGRVTAESATQRRGTETYNSYSTNWYNPDGTLSSSAVQSWKDGGGTTSNATTTYRYVWRDGPLTSAVTLTNTDGTTQSLYGYDEAGRLQSVTLTGGTRPRTVAVTTDLAGQILTRDELPQYTNAPAANPHEKRYIFDGVVMGEVGNDGTDNTTFAAAVAEGRSAEPQSTTANPAGPFRNGAFSGAAHADFDQNYDAVNYRNVATTPQSYTVRGGDTLAGIAQTLWGDANLWYLIAGANGLTADATLAEGQVLSIPSTVVNRGNTADTWRPYDPAEALGDVQPNTPVPQPRAAQGGRRNRCGIFGAILLAVVAVAVTVVTAGAAVAALAPSVGSLGAGISTVLSGGVASALGGGLGGTLGAIAIGAGSAAVGSAVSQGVGVATGLQDQFSFKGVALAAISGGVGAGIGASGLASRVGGVAGAAVSGLAGNVLTQGIAVATGLQHRFDWAGVAAAGVTGPVGYATAPRGSSFGAQLLSGAASGIAGAATRSLVEGTSFGDNILSVLPDVIGSTIGRLAAQAVGEASLRSGSRVPRLAVDPAALDDGGVVTGGTSESIERRIAELRASGRITPQEATEIRQFASEVKSRLAEQQAALDRANGQRMAGIGSDGKPNLVTRDAGYAIDLGTLEARVQAYDAQYGTGRYSVEGKQQFDASIANNRRLIEQWDRTAESEVNRLFGGFLLGSAGGALVGAGGAALVATAGWGAGTTLAANAGVAGLSSTATGLGYRPALGETNTALSAATDFAGGVVGFGVGNMIARAGSGLFSRIGLGRTAVESAPNIVYRGLTEADAVALRSGQGFTAKAPQGTWSAAEHVANSGPGIGGAAKNSPWISTSKRLDVATAYDSGNGVVAIDLSKVNSLQVEVWRTAPRVNGVEGLPYHRSIWGQEVTIHGTIPREAIIWPR
ncbi:DUF6531 domain-containing protein [Sphingomonas fuzhouensis]|uniref:DUF6531 domain-containing protein n=1 Tax=Sphingomonas fuzhouensis TaxID=3106033 RepID=UPI002AFDF260|nr:DUF6531 domain-containing protein [Sphingomonas sp. SGZ-02]